MSNIPKAREELSEVAARLKLLGLHALALRVNTIVEQHMGRAKAVRRAKPTSRPMTPTLKAAIRRYAKVFPERDLPAIATHFQVNLGRVSECLSGVKRDGAH